MSRSRSARLSSLVVLALLGVLAMSSIIGYQLAPIWFPRLSLGVLDDPRGAPVLIERLSDASEAFLVRAAAAVALGRLRAREAAPALRQSLFDPSPYVSACSGAALLRFADLTEEERRTVLAKTKQSEAEISEELGLVPK